MKVLTANCGGVLIVAWLRRRSQWGIHPGDNVTPLRSHAPMPPWAVPCTHIHNACKLYPVSSLFLPSRCLKACPNNSVEFRLRPPGIELWTTHKVCRDKYGRCSSTQGVQG